MPCMTGYLLSCVECKHGWHLDHNVEEKEAGHPAQVVEPFLRVKVVAPAAEVGLLVVKHLPGLVDQQPAAVDADDALLDDVLLV